jgi:hypothetical protein
LMGSDNAKLSSWNPLPLYPKQPAVVRGNFAHLWGFGGFAIDSYASTVLRPILENTCELMPFLPYNGEIFFRMNVLKRIDCLDREKTKWAVNKLTGAQSTQIEQYSFDSARFTNSSIFRLQKGPMILALDGLSEPESEFKSIVQREGLTGLKFEELWSEGGPPIKVKSSLD